MQTYLAHYSSPSGSNVRTKGVLEFESDGHVGTKGNLHDARLCMLEQFGKNAVSWTIDKVECKRANDMVGDGQLELDFRAPKPVRKRVKKKEYW